MHISHHINISHKNDIARNGASTLTAHMTCASASRSFFSSKSCNLQTNILAVQSLHLNPWHPCRLVGQFHSCHWPVSCRWSGCSAWQDLTGLRYGVMEFAVSMVFSLRAPSHGSLPSQKNFRRLGDLDLSVLLDINVFSAIKWFVSHLESSYLLLSFSW